MQLTHARENYTPGNTAIELTKPLTSVVYEKAGSDDIVNATPSFAQKTVYYFNEHASLIVLIWFLFFSIKLVRIMANMGYVQRIRNYKISEPPFYWKQRMKELCSELNIVQPVQLLESAIVKIPVVVGLLKPVILMPLGFLLNLSAEETEAVLLHELAHIKRKDYLVNLLQSFAEAIFFFNPAILWLSSLIREEREHCCDDIAISRTQNKKQFIHALVIFQEYAMDQRKGALAFAGRKKYLLNRVKRIINNENKKLNAMEKGIFILSIAIGFTGFVTMKQSPVQKIKPQTKAQLFNSVTDTIPNEKNTLISDSFPSAERIKITTSVTNSNGSISTSTVTGTDEKGTNYKLVTKKGEVGNEETMEFYINSKKIPSGELGKYEEVIAAIQRAAGMQREAALEKLKTDRNEQESRLSELRADNDEQASRMNELNAERDAADK